MADHKRRSRVIVLGDLVVDVVLAPRAPLEAGTDVPGRVMLRQGGSAANTARLLGRYAASVTLITAVGRDATGRALVCELRRDGVKVHAIEISGSRTGRIGVMLQPDGERSFVQDRAATLQLAPRHLRRRWFDDAALVHLPAYSILDEPLGDAGRRAARLAHKAGALLSIDLSSSGLLLAHGRAAALELVAGLRPDLVFATEWEAAALVDDPTALLEVAPIVALKCGRRGAVVLRREASDGLGPRLEIKADGVETTDTTGAGDAFDAGFILGWLEGLAAGIPAAAALTNAAWMGNTLAAEHLGRPREELSFD